MENHEPAYPTISDISHNAKWDTKQGMSLLDYFAGRAIPQLIQTGGHSTYDLTKNREGVASDLADAAYSIAAAMLEARKKYIK